MAKDSVNEVSETDQDDSGCIDHQVVTVDIYTMEETGGNTSQRPEH